MRRGFSYVEVLATLVLLAIVLPAVMNGISVSLTAAKLARDQAQATALAKSKLGELVVGGQWQHSELAGDFGDDAPGYHWQAVVTDWDADVLRQLDVTVVWAHRGGERAVSLSTLVYTAPAAAAGANSGGTTP